MKLREMNEVEIRRVEVGEEAGGGGKKLKKERLERVLYQLEQASCVSF